MALGTAADLSAIKRFVKQGERTAWLKESDSAGSPLTTGDGTAWTCIGVTKGTTIDVETNAYTESDDTGGDVVNEEPVKAYKVTTTLLQRDANTRALPINTIGKYYLLALQGNTIGTKTESHAFGVCKFSPKFSYKIGENAQFEGVTISTLTHTASLSITLPTEIGTGTITIPIGQMWATSDI